MILENGRRLEVKPKFDSCYGCLFYIVGLTANYCELSDRVLDDDDLRQDFPEWCKLRSPEFSELLKEVINAVNKNS